MKMSESLDQLIPAVIKFQNEVPAIKKDCEGYGYKYASLQNIVSVIKPILVKYGLCVTQNPHYNEEGTVVGIATHIEHVSGQYKHFDPVMIPINEKAKNIAQEVGTDVTYARRYSLACALNLVTDEDTDAFKPEPTKKAQGGFTKDFSAKYEAKKQSGNNLGAWNELAENEGLHPQTNLQNKQDTLVHARRKFFAKASEKGLTDKQMRGLAYYHFDKESRSQLTISEFVQLSSIVEQNSRNSLLHMIRKATQLKLKAI